LSATNAAQAPGTWIRVATNTFDAQGRFSLAIPVGGNPRMFYRLQSY